MSIGSIPIISPFNPDWNRQHSHNSCIPALPIPGLPRDEDICLLWFGYSQYSFLRTPTSNCSWPPNVCASASSSPQSLSKKNLGSSALFHQVERPKQQAQKKLRTKYLAKFSARKLRHLSESVHHHPGRQPPEKIPRFSKCSEKSLRLGLNFSHVPCKPQKKMQIISP